jgi:hypothetical protein
MYEQLYLTEKWKMLSKNLASVFVLSKEKKKKKSERIEI